MNDDVQALVEWVANSLRSMITSSHYDNLSTEDFYKRIYKILSHPSLLIEVKDAELPEYPGDVGFEGLLTSDVYLNAQDHMLQAGYKPVIPLSEYLKEVEK